MAPVENRLTISTTGSTSSIGIGSGRARHAAQPQQPAQGHQLRGLVVDQRRCTP